MEKNTKLWVGRMENTLQFWQRRLWRKWITIFRKCFCVEFGFRSNTQKKSTRKTISRILFSIAWTLVIYLRFTFLKSFSCLPLGFWSEPLLFLINEKNPIYLTLHRKEFTWFHYKWIYILSVALVLISRPTDVSRFAALWCPDFPTPDESGINKPFFLWTAKIGI